MKQTPKVFALTPPGTKAAESETGAETKKVRAPARGEAKRTPWNGGVKAEELARPGGILLGMLTQRANELGHQLADMAEELGVTYGYISQLRNGQRGVTTIREKFVDACARYLGVSPLTVLLAAGKIRPTDIYEDQHEVMQSVPNAVQFIKRDAEWGPVMPAEVASLDIKTQFFIVKLYEAATKRTLLPGASMDPEEIAKQIEAIQEYRAQLTGRVMASRETTEALEDAEQEA
jgi:transcriptional regulator with XRE-family HTH domain